MFIKTARRVDIPYTAHFIEQNASGYADLNNLLAGHDNAHCHLGDHEEILPNLLSELGSKPCYGMVYSDPNGLPPFELLRSISFLPTMKFIDILIHVGATTVKRLLFKHEMHLSDYLRPFNKKTWLVQDPEGKWQWSFLLGTNWEGFPKYSKERFYRIESEDGRRIFKKLDMTNEERARGEELRLFDESI